MVTIFFSCLIHALLGAPMFIPATPAEIDSFRGKINHDLKNAMNFDNVLGWQESRALMAFIEMYRVAKRSGYAEKDFFLDILVDHFNAISQHRDDRMFALTGDSQFIDQVRFPPLARKGWGSDQNSTGEYYIRVVHSGMITYPMAVFVRLVNEDPSLHEKYLTTAQKFLSEIKDEVAAFDGEWGNHNTHPPTGSFFGETGPYKGIVQPFNKSLSMGRTLVELHRLNQGSIYGQRAELLARYLKNNLMLKSRIIEGVRKTYWIWRYAEKINDSIEDLSHGALDVDFAMTYFESPGLAPIFSHQDIQRFINTFRYVAHRPDGTLSERVDGSGVAGSGERKACIEWLELAEIERDIWDLCYCWVKEKGFDLQQLGYSRLLKWRRTTGIPACIGSADPLI